MDLGEDIADAPVAHVLVDLDFVRTSSVAGGERPSRKFREAISSEQCVHIPTVEFLGLEG